MKYAIIFWLSFGVCLEGVAQDSLNVVNGEIDFGICVHHKVSTERLKRMKGYRDVHRVALVSFSEKSDDVIGQMPLQPDGIPDMSGMFEAVELADTNRDSILLILHNYSNIEQSEAVAACYDPHNGIIFYDRNNKIVGYIEICFSCHRYRKHWKGTVPTFCYGKWEALRKTFMNAGIQFGVQNEMPSIIFVEPVLTQPDTH